MQRVGTPNDTVTVLVMKGTESTPVKVDPSKYGFLIPQLQDEAYARQFVNTDEVIADLSEGTLGTELATDIAIAMEYTQPWAFVHLAAQILRGADYLQLSEELYLGSVVGILQDAANKVPPPGFQKEVVPCVHTGQLMWDQLGAYTVLQLEQRGIISLGHKGFIKAAGSIDDELLALANVLNDVRSLKVCHSGFTEKNITTCEPFADTLMELDAPCSGLTDEGLKHCKHIRKLDVSGVTAVTSCAPFADTLEELVAESSGITDATLHCCQKLRKLVICPNEHILFGKNTCDETTSSPCITSCAPFSETLEELHVKYGNVDITDEGLKDFTKLRKLTLTSTNIQITARESFKTLEELVVDYAVTKESLEKMVARCIHLKRLSILEGMEGATASVMQKISENCRQLEYLELPPYCEIGDDSLIAVSENCPLRCLKVSSAIRITDLSIIKVAENCPLLEHFDGNFIRDVTDHAFIALAEHCPGLKHLDVRATAVTDASIVKVAEKCPHLRYLDVTYNSEVTDVSITKVAVYCRRLEHLNVGGTNAITDVSIMTVAENCPELQFLDVSNTGGRITDTSFLKLAENCSQLRHIDIRNTEGRITKVSLDHFPSTITVVK